MTDLGEHFARVSITASNCAQKWERSHPTRVEIKGKDFLGLWNGSVWPQARQLKQILDRFCCKRHQRELLMHWQHHPTCVTKNQHETPKYLLISITWSRLKSLRINRFWTTRFCSCKLILNIRRSNWAEQELFLSILVLFICFLSVILVWFLPMLQDGGAGISRIQSLEPEAGIL